jgi:hypothetical protein
VKRLLTLATTLPTSPLAQPELLRKLIHPAKPVPTDINPSEGRLRFTLGTLSLVLNHTVAGYLPLPDFPDQAPPRDVRDEQVSYMPSHYFFVKNFFFFFFFFKKTIQIVATIYEEPTRKGKPGKSEKQTFLDIDEEEGEEEEEEEGEMNEEDEEGSEGSSGEEEGEEESPAPVVRKKGQAPTPSSTNNTNGLEDLFCEFHCFLFSLLNFHEKIITVADIVPLNSNKEEEPETEKNDLEDFFSAESENLNKSEEKIESQGSNGNGASGRNGSLLHLLSKEDGAGFSVEYSLTGFG